MLEVVVTARDRARRLGAMFGWEGLNSTFRRSILIGRKGRGLPRTLSKAGRKRVLMVLFIPSVERDGRTTVDQAYWTDEALEFFGRAFGGATAFPKARGIWRDDEKGGKLVKDEPIILHCYTEPDAVMDDGNLTAPGSFCRRLGRETKQGEVGFVIGDEYFAIHDFE